MSLTVCEGMAWIQTCKFVLLVSAFIMAQPSDRALEPEYGHVDAPRLVTRIIATLHIGIGGLYTSETPIAVTRLVTQSLSSGNQEEATMTKQTKNYRFLSYPSPLSHYQRWETRHQRCGSKGCVP
ncbi:uncharacterized protein BDZ83DRAFT_102804 [Colletotrichum acutatum]|uniref:Secreted protein n=1 Tax=Glomerella acutata TaxID=27357 RepID=A0AAD8XK25_GLOAC|nr:uncharacterized protein BDZ83DRAFT_102804 [Colletotrichum acutatum]KAK1728810.1 hypothetical protein BDZ83DRAFT_102804 [Colletotrichum acutatum]